jgi:NAD dependent epimerase/dehydratase family enzyme
VLLRLARFGLGGSTAGGQQFVSWIHDADFLRAIDFLIVRDDLSGPVNLASPNPLANRDFMATLRRAGGIPIGLPATRWMLEIGAWALRTETELILKSRRVIPTRLLAAGFEFRFPTWDLAARDLIARARVHP